MISEYKAMWVIVSFDISTLTKDDRYNANAFRKDIISLGFTRLQLSVYSYYCYSKDKADRVSDKVAKLVPANGHITIMFLTDRQFRMTRDIYGGVKRQIHPPDDSVFLF